MDSKKQHIVVRALIVSDNKILLVKRVDDGSVLAGKFELPGGRVEFGESADQAINRELSEEIGQDILGLKIEKLYSYVYSTTHVIGICYKVEVDHQFVPKLNAIEHDNYEWFQVNNINELFITDEVPMVLGINDTVDVVTNTNLISIVKLFTDGGSRGNPGPSALGFVIYDSNENVLQKGSRYLGITTNNQAEYQAVKAGLEACRQLGALRVQVFLDSQLVANQMNGIYKIKNRELWPIHESIKNMISDFKEGVSFTYIPRELNKAADAMVNEELDKATSI